MTNSFPVCLVGDVHSNLTGGHRIIQYRLIAGEAGWILEAEKVVKEDQ